jgi:hypothetical protein
MPSNESLQQFNDLLIETGNEPAIAAERGEQVEDVAAPQPGEFEVGSPADAALSSAEDFFSNLAESIEESETGDDIDGLSPPEDDFLNDLGLGDEEPRWQISDSMTQRTISTWISPAGILISISIPPPQILRWDSRRR